MRCAFLSSFCPRLASSLKGCLSHSVTVRSSTRSCPRRVTHICSTAHPRPRPRVRNKDFRYLQYSYVEKIEKLENALLVLLQPVMLAIPGLPTIVCQCEMHGTLHPETGCVARGDLWRRWGLGTPQ